MEWTGSTKAALCFVALLQLSCHLWMVTATPLTICVDQDLSITADSNLRLFIDGVEVIDLQHPTAPGNADTTLLQASAQVVAVSGQNEVVYGGFLGSTGTFVTDASWKCTDQFQSGWEEVGFDDSTWQQAYEVRVHGDSPWNRVSGIRRDARWIWIKPKGCIQEGIITVYCRKSLAGTCISTPPSPTTTTQSPTATPTTTPTQSPTATPTTTAIQCPTAAPTNSPPACENQPPTAPEGSSCSGTGPTCITSCASKPDGYYQSCKGCEIYASCTDQILTDGLECPDCLYWDDRVKRCEYRSTTCTECQGKLCSGTGSACISSCRRRADGDYQSCKGWDVYATCFNGRLFADRSCAASGL